MFYFKLFIPVFEKGLYGRIKFLLQLFLERFVQVEFG